jgi:P-type Cu+ transporter
MTKDPVCGMNIDVNQAKGQSNHNGQTYYFCSDSCKQKFDANPQQYAKKSA